MTWLDQPVSLARGAETSLSFPQGWDDVPSVLDPRGPAAAELAGLSTVLFVTATAVFVVTMLFLLVALRHRARHGVGMGFVGTWGIALPAALLVGCMVLAVRSGAIASTPSTDARVVIEVIGHQFWWEIRYDDGRVVTANEVVVPAGEPVELRMTSADVIHSFWVPQLQGKTDLIPGRETTMWVQADEPGTYRGFCAEFCGIQHAKMQHVVVAVPADEFGGWLERQAAPAAEPATASARDGRAVFLSSSCVHCHTIRGASSIADVGPDLTHLAGRSTIAAGILPNNRGNLGGWILDPQSQKPGVRMPGTHLDGPELQALLDYLETLE